MKILVIEDEKLLADSIKEMLERKGFQVEAVYDGETGKEYAELGIYDLLILDVMMPKMDGITTASRIREFSNVPILFLTAKSETEDLVLGLNVGGDDYITKPFVPVEVLARVRSHLRRYATLGSRPKEDEDTVTVGPITLVRSTKTVTVDGDPIPVTPIEYNILELLMKNPGKVYSTKALYEAVWQESAMGSEGAVAVHIRHLREKIEIDPSNPRWLKVVWGQGYKLEGGR